MTKILYSGSNSQIPHLLWRKGFTVYAKGSYNWESWCYGNKQLKVAKATPGKFGKYLLNEVKTLNIQVVVIYRGADKSQRTGAIQPPFWHVDPGTLHNLMDSGIAVAIVNNSHDYNKSLDFCDLPKSCHFYKNDPTMSDVEMVSLFSDRLPRLLKKVDEQTAPCCRGKYL